MTRMIGGMCLKRGQSITVDKQQLLMAFRTDNEQKIPVWVELSDGRRLSIRRDSGEFFRIIAL